MRPKILVVEDEDPIRVGICDLLAYHGFEPTPAATGDDGRAKALGEPFDLLILDVMLPGVDGFTICEAARAHDPRVSILMLTAKGSEADVLRGFEAGCDDYLAKPFSLSILVARIRALLRRRGGPVATRPDPAADESLVEPAPADIVGRDGVSVSLDVPNLEAEHGGKSVGLSPREVAVLQYFGAHCGRVVTREELLKQVWGYARVDAVETRCVDMHIVKLRKKLKSIGAQGLIETVRGAGYRVRAEA